MKRPAVLVLGSAWLGVVVLTSVITWTVIDAAGRGVIDSGDPVALPAVGLTPDGATDPARVGRQTVLRPKPEATSSPGESDGPTTPAPSAAASTPAASPSTAPPVTSSPPPPTSPPGNTAQAQVRSWQGSAGTVVARCVGSRISLQSATPNDGWGVQVDKRGPSEVEVEFDRNGEAEGEAHVQGRCSGGAPRFEAEVRGGGEADDRDDG